MVADSPFLGGPHTSPEGVKGPRDAFDASLAFLGSACTPAGGPATFLLDEVLDLRTFESFPGLRAAVSDVVSALGSSPNRFVLATRFVTRANRLVAGGNGRLELYPVPQMSADEVGAALEETPHLSSPTRTDAEVSRTVRALTEGRPGYVRLLLDAMSSMGDRSEADPVGALAALLASGGALAASCRFSYELRLHRARGYGALKAILDVLAEEEPLSLTAIAQRLERTPGSTKDYLGWLEDVDLVASERKRYRIHDPLLRLWIRLQSRPAPPSEAIIVAEVQRYAMLRLAAAARLESAADAQRPVEPAGPGEAVGAATTVGGATTTSEAPARSRSSGIVEFD
jgi:hypothetical protein